MSQPGEIEDLTRALRRDLERAWALIVAEQTAIAAAWPTIPAAVREHRLALFQVQVLTLMDEVDAQAAATITRAMTTAYETGAWVTAISGLAEPTFTGISSAAITGLAQTTMDDLLTATSGVRETTKALIRELTRDQVINVLYTGVTPADAARDLRRLLEKHQIHAVTYADGKRIGLAQYSEMVLRTKTAEAYQAGGLDQGEALGWDWWEIMDGPGCGWRDHNDPQKANGMIVDIEAAKEHRLSHPSCRRSSTPRPDIASAREAAVALPTSPEALAEIQARAVAAQAATHSTLPAPAGVAKTATVATPARAVTAATLARPVTQAS